MQTIVPSIMNAVAAAACLIFGGMVLLRHPGKITHRAFALLTGALALWALCVVGIVQSASVETARTWLSATEVIFCILPALFYTFIGYFPKGHFDGSRPLCIALYAFGLLLACTVFSPWYIGSVELVSGAPPAVTYGPAFAGIPILCLTGICAIHANLRRKLQISVGIERRQLQNVMFAIYSTLTLGVFTNIVAPIFGVRFLQPYGPLSVVILIAFFAYAMIRYHLLDARVLLAKLVVYGTVTTLMALILGAGLFALTRFGDAISLAAQIAVTLIVALVVVMCMPLATRLVERILEGSLLSQRYDVHRMYSRIAEHAAAVVQFKPLLETICHDIRDTIGTRTVRCLLVSEDDPTVFKTEFTTLPDDPITSMDTASPVLAYLRDKGKPLILEQLLHPRPRGNAVRIAAQLAEIDAYFCLPLRTNDGLVGILTLGQKDSHDIYSTEEIVAFRAMAGPLGTAIENARLYQELERVNLHLARVFGQMREGVVAVDAHGNVTTFNESAVHLLGPIALGAPLSDLPPEVGALLDQTLRNARPVAEFETELSRAPRDGELTPVVLSSSCLAAPDSGLAGAVALIYDLSQIKRLEQNVQRADRLSSLGTLAAGMAHEIKNPLVSIKTFTQLFSTRYQDAEFRATFNEVVPHEVERIDTIVSRLLDFARSRPATLRAHPIEKIVREVLALVENQLRDAGVALDTIYEVGDIEIHGDEQQLHQVLLNLVLNAIEAMEDTEQKQLKVEVETSFVRLRNVRANASAETECIRVILTDTGVGIPQSSMERLFTPFFTTKEDGCGLGLSVVHGIVAEHGGDIDVSSVPGRGTVFTLTLPSVAKPAAVEMT